MTSRKKWRPPNPKPSKVTSHHRVRTVTIIAIVASLVILGYVSRSIAPSKRAAKSVGYAIGTPSSGALAPDFSLPSTSGTTVNLVDFRGKSVLLFFHEGIGCQPCWDQIRDLESARSTLQAAGVDQLLTITSGPTRLIAQKMADDRLTAIALGDTNLEVSKKYHANQFGMMGDSRDGHSFVLVGPDGRIDWRADYGGPPRYTMYVPLSKILADMKAGRSAA